jgi:hypothetical protein
MVIKNSKSPPSTMAWQVKRYRRGLNTGRRQKRRVKAHLQRRTEGGRGRQEARCMGRQQQVKVGRHIGTGTRDICMSEGNVEQSKEVLVAGRHMVAVYNSTTPLTCCSRRMVQDVA